MAAMNSRMMITGKTLPMIQRRRMPTTRRFLLGADLPASSNLSCIMLPTYSRIPRPW